jgi:hypothetical protein
MESYGHGPHSEVELPLPHICLACRLDLDWLLCEGTGSAAHGTLPEHLESPGPETHTLHQPNSHPLVFCPVLLGCPLSCLSAFLRAIEGLV